MQQARIGADAITFYQADQWIFRRWLPKRLMKLTEFFKMPHTLIIKADPCHKA
jgi:hypothetical protein